MNEPRRPGYGCGCAIGLVILAVVLTAVAWFTIVCEGHGPMCGGGLQCLPDCRLDSNSERAWWAIALIAIWGLPIGVFVWSQWEGTPTMPGSRVSCPSCGRRIASGAECLWCAESDSCQSIECGSCGYSVKAGLGKCPNCMFPIDGLVTCPACNQRTAPGAECQWCNEPLGGEG